MSATPAALVEEALEHLGRVRAHLALVSYHPDLALDAVCLRLAAALDCVGRLPPDLRDAACDGAWPVVRGMRNRIVHGYSTVDPVMVLRTLERRLEPLERGLDDVARVLRQ
ncbi:HepT-like ribonuclease domain-containing protein [Cellulomonas endometrii]|uniref:HepT-like ribonuclease domain-containing protein n=1 Tax=Cellulomonas endometrii TaxID=3036301 RepID=UPI0024AE3EFA|nr:HepT-like ribonuclease domain-containing protein [Cellulomonas endometrii]